MLENHLRETRAMEVMKFEILIKSAAFWQLFSDCKKQIVAYKL